MSTYEAVELFVDRARAVQPSFGITSDNARAIARICHCLDGIPLALELAAAQMRMLTAEQIAVRLADRFGLLTGGSRTALPRQQTLRATVDWSYSLLSGPEQVLLGRLAAFAGGFAVEAAEAVCAGDLIGSGDVFGLLTQLTDKSLVQVDRPDASARYRLLETIHEYAWDRLGEMGDGEATRRRHAAYFLELAEAAQAELRGFGGPHLAEWLARLEREYDNLRAALRWTVESGDAECGARLACALWRFWVRRGHISEGWRWLQELLTARPSARDAPAWAQVLLGAGVLARFRGDLAASRQYGQASADRLRDQGDRLGLAEALVDLGTAARMQGDAVAARACYGEGLAIRRDCGEQSGVLHALSQLGLLAEQQGHLARARRLAVEVLGLSRALQNHQGISTATRILGRVAVERGDWAAAVEWFRESLTTSRATGYLWGVSMSVLGFAHVAAAQKQAERALRLVGAVAAMHETMGVALVRFRQSEIDRWLAPCRQVLGDAEASAAWAEGHALTLEQAIAYALDEDTG